MAHCYTARSLRRLLAIPYIRVEVDGRNEDLETEYCNEMMPSFHICDRLGKTGLKTLIGLMDLQMRNRIPNLKYCEGDVSESLSNL